MSDRHALLVMDVQEQIVERYADDPQYLTRVRQAITTARLANLPVIYVVVGFRSGHPRGERA